MMENQLSEQVQATIADYPANAKKVFMQVRKIILAAAKNTAGLENTAETLKWGEPSYLAKGGSTVRMKWSDKSPDNFYLYFNCQSVLVETFKELYADEFTFDGNRAMSFPLNKKIPKDALLHCVSMAMEYHKLKKLPLLGN